MSEQTKQILSDVAHSMQILRKQLEAEIRIIEELDEQLAKLKKRIENEQHS